MPTLMQLSTATSEAVQVSSAPTQSDLIPSNIATDVSAASNEGIEPVDFANDILTPTESLAPSETAITQIDTALPLPTMPPLATLPPPQAIVPNQVVIAFKPETSQEQRDAYIASLGGEVKQSIEALNTVIVEVPTQSMSAALPPSNVVMTTEPNYYVSALMAIPPSDPLYEQQWALPVIGAPQAWQLLPADAPKVTVAVIDSGICADHPDLAGRILPGWDFVENDAQPQDDYGHGCGVSGIIAANGDNGISIAGVAPNAMILPLRVLNAQGIGSYSDVAAALVYAADNGAQVINLSLGGTNASSVMEDAINYAISKGVMVVAAAGNTGGAVLYPAAYAPVIAVGSIDPNLARSDFSSYGPEIDLMAPGRNITTLSTDGSIRVFSGTSFAAPQVAGVTALEIGIGQTLALGGGIVHFGAAEPAVTETLTPTLAPTPLDESQLTETERTLLDQVRQQGTTEVIVGLNTPFSFADQASPQDLAAQDVNIQQLRTSVIQSLSAYDVQILSDSSSWVIPFVALRVDEAALTALLTSGNVSTIEPNGQNRLSLDSAEPVIHAPQVWAMGYTGSGQTVAIVDSGIDRTHAFLNGHVVNEACYSSASGTSGATSNCPNGASTQTGIGAASPSKCFANMIGTPDEALDCAHGTHVSGIAAGYQSTSFSGVAPNANIIGVDVFSKYHDAIYGDYLTAFDSDILSGLNYVYSIRGSYSIAAVNISLGDYSRRSASTCDSTSTSMTVMFQQLRSVGIAPVVATGNEHDVDPSKFVDFPACISSAIGVGATNDADVIASFSNRASIMSLFAPGVDITSSVPIGSVADPGGGFAAWDGTSMATPFITGAFAVYRQFMPGAPVDYILNAFRTTGQAINIGGGTIPRLNLETAVNANLPPFINTQPQNQNIGSGLSATLNVVAGGKGTLSYQWYRGNASDTSHPVGTNSASYTTPALTITTSYWVRVTSSTGHIDSVTAIIGVVPSCLTFPYTVPAGDVAKLKSAIDCANTNGAGTNDVINLTNSTYTLTTSSFVSYFGTITSASTSGTLTINGNGAIITRSSANGTPNFRFFEIANGGDLTLNGLTLDNGYAYNDRGGAIKSQGMLTVNNSTLSNNRASEAGAIDNEGGTVTLNNTTLSRNTSNNTGGAVLNYYNSTLNVVNSTFYFNIGVNGGGIMNFGTATVNGSTFDTNWANYTDGGAIRTETGTLTVSNSTFFGNSAGAHGGGIATWSGTTTITNSTFFGNTAWQSSGIGGGIFNAAGTVSIGNTILSSNGSASSGPNISGTITSLGYNVISNTSGATITGTTTGNLTGAAAQPLNLSNMLGNNGGSTQTLAIDYGSVAINAGDPAFTPPPNYDQRGTGFSRVSGGRIDIGALEFQCPTFPYIVPAGDTARLIFAINCANTNGAGSNDVITLTNSTYILAAANNLTDGGNGLPVIVDAATSGTLTINGSGATIIRSSASGTPNFRILEIAAGGNLTLGSVTLTNGNVSDSGGAIYNLGTLALDHVNATNNTALWGGGINSTQTLTVTNSMISNNSANQGGGIYNDGTVTITDTTISANTSTNPGGGLINTWTMTVLRSTVSGNTASSGGGVLNVSTTLPDHTIAGGVLNVVNSTIANNTANGSNSADSSSGVGGAIETVASTTQVVFISSSTIANNTATKSAASGIWLEGRVLFQNTIVANNNGANNCAVHNGGAILDNMGNLDNGSSCGFGGIVGTNGNPLLGPLADNGGAIQTMALQAGSAAINTGSDGRTFDQNGNPLTTDQRGAGFARVYGSSVDIGAFEVQPPVCTVFPHTVPAGDVADLITAINCANSNGAGTDDVITLTNSTYTLTVVDNSNPDGANGLPQIPDASISGKLTINGNGATIQRSDGEIYFRFFSLSSNFPTSSDLTLNNLTLTNGSMGNGGGIWSYGTLKLNNVTISASNAANSGGAIYNGGTLTITSSTFSNNTALSTYEIPNTGGGAIYNAGTLTISGSTFTSNSGAKNGGAIQNVSNSATVSSSTFTGNTAISGGTLGNIGTLALNSSTISGSCALTGSGINNIGTLTVIGSTFSGNLATNFPRCAQIDSSGTGGGISNLGSGTAAVINSTFYNNTAISGGALENGGTATLTVSNSTLFGNYADSSGGGIYTSGGTTNLNNSIVTASTHGGDCVGTVTVKFSLVSDGSCGVVSGISGNLVGNPQLGALTGSPAYYPLLENSPMINRGDYQLIPVGITTDQAGGTRVYGGLVDIGAYEAQKSDCPAFPYTVPAGQSNLFGFAIACANDTTINDTINLINSTYLLTTPAYHNVTGPGLPAISAVSGSGTLTINGNGATIARSSAAGTPNMGLILIATNGNLTLNNVTLSNSADAPAIDNEFGTLTVNNSTISGNSAASGAGLYNRGTSTVNNTIISNNVAVTAGGGGIYNGGSLTLSHSTLSGNTLSHNGVHGGGVYNIGIVTVSDSTISGNSTSQSGSGGAIFNYNAATLTITNTTFSNNEVGTDGSGGAIFNEFATLTVSASNFTTNSAPVGNSGGGAIFNQDGTTTVNTSTFTGNSANKYGGAIDNDTSNGTVTINSSTFNANSAGQNGGAIFNSGTVTVSNSTIANNQSGNFAGGLYNISGTATVTNSTFSSNTAVKGGGILQATGSVKLGSSIVSSNSATTAPDFFGAVNSLGYNLIGTTSGTTIVGTTTGNRVNGAASPLNLGPLQDNGGLTQTWALQVGSVAISAGNCATLAGIPAVTTDQRGVTRKSPCDIGAYETRTASITTPPQSQSIFNGQTATLTVVAAGDLPLTYQWYQGTSPNISTPVGTNAPSFTTPVLTSTTSYWVRVTNAFGSANSATAVITTSTNFVTNGDFSGAMTGWQTFGNIASRVNNGVFEFYHNTTQGSVRPSILQAIPTAFSVGTSLEFRMDLGNSGSMRKRALVFIVNQDWTDLQTCSFWIEPHSPLRTYVLQGRPTLNWPSAQVAIYANPADNTGWLQVDNVSLRQLAGSSAAQTLCIDPTTPAPGSGSDSSNLLVNGGFSAGMSNWITFGNITSRLNSGVFEFYHNTTQGSVRPSVLQNSNMSLNASTPVELQLQLGNSGNVRKRALVILFQYDWTDLQMCSFWIPPNTPLGTYRMQTSLPSAWSNVSATIYANPADNTGWLRVDNVSLLARPSLALTGTNCYEPGAGPAGLSSIAEVLPSETPTAAVTDEDFPTTDEPLEMATEEATEIVTEAATETATEVVDTPSATATEVTTETVTEAPTVLPTALPFPTLPPPPPVPTDLPTALPFPTLPPPESPTADATTVLLTLPAVATFDDGAPDWQATNGWMLDTQAAFGGEGFGWQVSAGQSVAVLRWGQPLDLRTVPSGQTVQLTFQSLLTSTDASASVQVTTDGSTWLNVADLASVAEWTMQTVDLTPYIGQVIQLQFVWQGRVVGTADSWSVDDVSVAAVPPVFTLTPSATIPEISTEGATTVELPSATFTLIPPTPTDADTSDDVTEASATATPAQ